MTDAAAANDGQPTVEHAALGADGVSVNPAEPLAAAAVAAPSGPPAPAAGDEHPERAVGAAFAGGLVLALLLKRLAR
jgi:hypothetical protein